MCLYMKSLEVSILSDFEAETSDNIWPLCSYFRKTHDRKTHNASSDQQHQSNNKHLPLPCRWYISHFRALVTQTQCSCWVYWPSSDTISTSKQLLTSDRMYSGCGQVIYIYVYIYTLFITRWWLKSGYMFCYMLHVINLDSYKLIFRWVIQALKVICSEL